jgi:hypothetical protein
MNKSILFLEALIKILDKTILELSKLSKDIREAMLKEKNK